MNITKENIDALNAVVKVDIVADDYQEKVTEILNDYRKKADIPGFRKGHIPMGMVKKKYGKAILIDEVNKLLEDSLNKFLTEEDLDILGNPLPKIQEDFSWDAETFSFEFELGLAPKFDVKLKSRKKVNQYNIIATDKFLDEEIESIQKRYGKMHSLDEATKDSNITGTFVNEEKEISKTSTFSVSDLKGKKNEKKLIGAKVGDVIELETKKLFENEYRLNTILGASYDEAEDLDITIILTIEEITTIEPADLNKELFDKLFTDGGVNTVTELRERIKETVEKQFKEQSDQQLLKEISDHLVENIKFDLPSEFLQKWLATSRENKLTPEKAAEQYNNLEKGLRYQLIETKIMEDNDIVLEDKELIDHIDEFARLKLAEFGNTNPTKNELDTITAGIVKNKDNIANLQKQLLDQKMLAFYKENINLKIKEVSYEDFFKEVYK
ncbi:MAG: trigger factor [Polaribacter sp.]